MQPVSLARTPSTWAICRTEGPVGRVSHRFVTSVAVILKTLHKRLIQKCSFLFCIFVWNATYGLVYYFTKRLRYYRRWSVRLYSSAGKKKRETKTDETKTQLWAAQWAGKGPDTARTTPLYFPLTQTHSHTSSTTAPTQTHLLDMHWPLCNLSFLKTNNPHTLAPKSCRSEKKWA